MVSCCCKMTAAELRDTYKDDLKEHFLVDLHKLLVPFLNLGGLLAGVGLVVLGLDGVVTVVLAPLNHFSEHRLIDLETRQ